MKIGVNSLLCAPTRNLVKRRAVLRRLRAGTGDDGSRSLPIGPNFRPIGCTDLQKLVSVKILNKAS
jgi:hypothetical protein